MVISNVEFLGSLRVLNFQTSFCEFLSIAAATNLGLSGINCDQEAAAAMQYARDLE